MRSLLIWVSLALGVAMAPFPTGAATPGKLVFVSPLPFGVDVYLKIVRQGSEAAGTSLALPTKIFESPDPETRSENMRAALHEGASIIVVTGFEFADIVPDMAAENPGVKFLMVDECPSAPMPNVFCVLFKEYEANFLAGVEAGLSSKTGRIGTVAASDIPYMHRYSDAFAAGARLARPEITVVPTLWVGGDNAFSDPLRAQGQAAAMLSQGVDRLLAATSAGNGGIFKEVGNSAGILAFGVDIDQCGEAPGHVLDSAVKHVDRITARAIEGIANGTQPNAVSYGLKEGAVGLTGLENGMAPSHCLVSAQPEIVAKVAEIRDAIIAGRITVADPMVETH